MTRGQISEKGNGFFSSPKNAQTDSEARSMGTGESDREIETRPVRREEIMLVTIREERYVSEPIGTKYSKFCLLILIRSSGI
jgi:hypothetical protein